ncbi:hypothetical protein ACO0K2_04265 [Undibacterium sp. MH2W]|uniref:hypothetical protein n=1 Tax=Undibacterium sp. MH2W TaxID=3413044 RepID=UPI003BF00926
MNNKKLTQDEKFELDSYLNNFIKNSRHINGMLDNQRIAIAQAFGIIIRALVKHDSSLIPVLLSAMTEIESKTFTSASLDGERSLVARAIRAELFQTSNAQEGQVPLGNFHY